MSPAVECWGRRLAAGEGVAAVAGVAALLTCACDLEHRNSVANSSSASGHDVSHSRV